MSSFFRSQRLFYLLLAAIVVGYIYFFRCQERKSNRVTPTLIQFWKKPKNLAVVIPFTFSQKEVLASSLGQWSTYRLCEMNGTASRHTTLIFYFHKDLDAFATREAKQVFREQILGNAFHDIIECFNEVKFLSAKLSDEDDVYPGGPSNQFYRLLLENDEFQKAFQVMFWMEPDVFPIKHFWLDTLYIEAISGKFWMKGSMYKGTSIVLSIHTKRWLGHINGNALYAVGNPEFNAVLRASRQDYSPRAKWNPFDACLYLYLLSDQVDFRIWQYAASKYVYSDFIYNYGTKICEADINTAKANPNCVLVHGKSWAASQSQWREDYSHQALLPYKHE